ncbi:MAG: hypothetical protein EA420_16535 [Candidatus Competibacteraceae bacterium]|nr:MAG: hypothetical protein EA420_16535 [Candidatus Competibacteraceae bacterium]
MTHHAASHRIAFALAALLLAAAPERAASAVDPGETYDTRELIGRTVAGLKACLKYCLLGIEIRIRYTGYSVEVYYVPRVEHHLACLHGMAADRFPKEPYREWAALVGVLQQRLLDRLAAWVGRALLGAPIVESGGGPTRYGQYGEHQSTNFKEVEFMGHPVALLPALLDKNGDLTADAYPEGETGAGGGGVGELSAFIESWNRWAVRCFTDPNRCGPPPAFPGAAVAEQFDLAAAIEDLIAAVRASGVDFAAIARTLREIASAVGDNAWGGGGVKIDRLLCPNDVDYFYPYYLSGVDAPWWRSGWPITDAEYAAIVLNPFSGDRIGRAGELWGHVYPRHGFLNHDHPGRVAPALVYRGADLLADHRVRRPKRTTAYARGDWQSVSPVPTRYCRANIADLPTPIDPEGGYGYNLWPRFECPLSEIGILVAFIPYRYCFTK